MKKITKLFLTFFVLSLIVGCAKKAPSSSIDFNSASESSNVEFTELLDSIFVDLLDPKDFTINLLFNDPEKYGITPEPYELTYPKTDDLDEYYCELEDYLKQVKDFKDNDLSQQQLIDKYVVIEYIQDTLDMKEYVDYELGTGVIGVARSLMGSLPAYLETYNFNSKRDVESYIHFIDTLPNSIKEYINLELERQSKGTGYGQEEIDEIVDQYQGIHDAAIKDDYFLLSHFKHQMSEISFLSDQEKAAYIQKHNQLITTNFADAYGMIATEFSKIESKPSTGLANKPNGKNYYELLLQQSTGKKKSIKDIEKMIDDKFIESLVYLQTIGEAKHDALFETYSNQEFGDFKNGRELLSYIEDKYLEDYPKIESPNYDLRQVDASMAESSSPAFYFTPSIDYSNDQKQVIYINGVFDNSLYTTYAHEGLPGHMYQFSYFLGLDTMHPIRSIITSSANAEGWANYVEKDAVKYVQGEQFKDFYTAYQTLTEIIHIKADIGVHYYGWDYSTFSDYINTNFNIDEEEVLKDFYLQIITNPATYPTYYLSSLYYEELKEKAIKDLDDAFDLVEFHKEILDLGSASFNLMSKKIDYYLSKK